MAERDAGVGDSPSPAGVPGLGPPMSSAHLWPGCCGPGLGRQGLRQEHFKIKSLIPELGARAPVTLTCCSSRLPAPQPRHPPLPAPSFPLSAHFPWPRVSSEHDSCLRPDSPEAEQRQGLTCP